MGRRLAVSLQDPLADALTRIRNAQATKKPSVSMHSSKLKVALCLVLKKEGYIKGFQIQDEESVKPCLHINLKYFEDKPVIEELQRVSRPGLRVYAGARKLPRMKGGLGVYIVSTSCGLMTDHQARLEGLGGEILCALF